MAKTVEGGILSKLEENLSEEDSKKLIRKLSELLQHKRVKGQLNRSLTQTNNGEAKNKGNKHTYYLWISLLHYHYNISLKDLGLSKDDPLYKSISEKAKDDKYYNKIIQLDGFNHNSTDKENIGKIYLKANEIFVGQVKSSLKVYDYLERQYLKSQHHEYDYLNVQDEIFQEIESQVIGEKKEYIRLLCLPLRVKEIEKARIDINALKEGVLKYISLPLYKHMYRTLKNHPELGYPSTSSGFFMIATAPINYHFAIQDGGDKTLSEYFKYDESGICEPDIMFIDVSNTENSKSAEIYNLEFDKCIKRGVKFLIQNCEKELKDLIVETQSQIEKFDDEVRPLNEKAELEASLDDLEKKLEFHRKNS